MLITMIDNWEEGKKAQERANRFRDTLLWLNKELPQHNDLTAQLRLIAKASQEALEVSQVSIWQISPDRPIHLLRRRSRRCQRAVGRNGPAIESLLDLRRTSLDEERVIGD